MSQHIAGTKGALSASTLHAPSLYAVLVLRLTFGLMTLLGAIITFLATSWDVQWHIFVGRDRTLTAPHLLMLTGIAVGGIGALLSVIIETTWVKRHPELAKRLTPFAGIFGAPLGAYIAGYAALNAAVAFPLDQYWHTLYGIDVTLWAPFHVMILSGLALVALGAAYMLASTVNLATSLHSVKEKRAAAIGMIVAVATSLSFFMLLAFNGIDVDNSINLGFVSFSLFPMLAGLLLGSLLVAVAYAAPWRWAATSVMAICALFLIIDQIGVPPAMVWLMQVEQLSYLTVHRSTPPQISVVTIKWPLLSIVTAILIDVFFQLAHKYGWSKRLLSMAVAGAVFVSCLPVTIQHPGATFSLIMALGVFGVLLSVVTGGFGIFVGTKLGEMIGKTMSRSER